MLKKLVWGLVGLLALLVAVVAVNTLRKGSHQLAVPPIPVLAVDEPAAAQRLGEAVRLRTPSSRDDGALNADQFTQLHALLQTRFPKLHATLKREVVGGLSLLYTWPGRDANARPILLMAHQDVVPVAPGTEKDWSVDAFSGEVKDGFIWGRGAWDDKANLMAQLEAVEMLVAAGYRPERTVYLAFGADEEVGGYRGAARIAALLKERKVRLDFVLDEGLLITQGIMPGLAQPVAIIGIAEKGYLSVQVKTHATPGHSSMPPAKGSSAIAMLSAALNLMENDQFPASIRGVAAGMFDAIAPEMTGLSRVALSNLWLFGPIVQKQLEVGASTNAMMRTTTALTIVNAGNKDNVLPGRAEATVNYRILPGDTIAQVTERAKIQAAKAVGGDADAKKIEVTAVQGGQEPSKVASTDGAPYQLLNRTVREVFPGVLVAPGLMLGGTDSTHFGELSDHIFKFSPVRAAALDLSRFHGTNERMATANYAELIRFYHRLLTQATRQSTP